MLRHSRQVIPTPAVNRSISRWGRQHAHLSPAGVALSAPDRSLTYSLLNDRADRAARVLSGTIGRTQYGAGGLRHSLPRGCRHPLPAAPCVAGTGRAPRAPRPECYRRRAGRLVPGAAGGTGHPGGAQP